jgi:nucleoside 2-deoxyribosyltransferase
MTKFQEKLRLLC